MRKNPVLHRKATDHKAFNCDFELTSSPDPFNSENMLLKVKVKYAPVQPLSEETKSQESEGEEKKAQESKKSMHAIFIADISSSMKVTGVQSEKDAIKQIIGSGILQGGRDHVSGIVFDFKATIFLDDRPLPADPKEQSTLQQEIQDHPAFKVSGGTAIDKAFEAIQSEWLAGRTARIFFLTDGAQSPHNPHNPHNLHDSLSFLNNPLDPHQVLKTLADRLGLTFEEFCAQYPIYVFGLGDAYNRESIAPFAELTRGDIYHVQNNDQIPGYINAIGSLLGRYTPPVYAQDCRVKVAEGTLEYVHFPLLTAGIEEQFHVFSVPKTAFNKEVAIEFELTNGAVLRCEDLSGLAPPPSPTQQPSKPPSPPVELNPEELYAYFSVRQAEISASKVLSGSNKIAQLVKIVAYIDKLLGKKKGLSGEHRQRFDDLKVLINNSISELMKSRTGQLDAKTLGMNSMATKASTAYKTTMSYNSTILRSTPKASSELSYDSKTKRLEIARPVPLKPNQVDYGDYIYDKDTKERISPTERGVIREAGGELIELTRTNFVPYVKSKRVFNWMEERKALGRLVTVVNPAAPELQSLFKEVERQSFIDIVNKVKTDFSSQNTLPQDTKEAKERPKTPLLQSQEEEPDIDTEMVQSAEMVQFAELVKKKEVNQTQRAVLLAVLAASTDSAGNRVRVYEGISFSGQSHSLVLCATESYFWLGDAEFGKCFDLQTLTGRKAAVDHYEDKGLDGVLFQLFKSMKLSYPISKIPLLPKLSEAQEEKAKSLDLTCPIHLGIMREPMELSFEEKGKRYVNYYDKSAIEKWLAQHQTNPMTNQALPSDYKLTPAPEKGCQIWEFLLEAAHNDPDTFKTLEDPQDEVALQAAIQKYAEKYQEGQEVAGKKKVFIIAEPAVFEPPSIGDSSKEDKETKEEEVKEEKGSLHNATQIQDSTSQETPDFGEVSGSLVDPEAKTEQPLEPLMKSSEPPSTIVTPETPLISRTDVTVDSSPEEKEKKEENPLNINVDAFFGGSLEETWAQTQEETSTVDKSSAFLFFLLPLLGELGMESFSLMDHTLNPFEIDELVLVGALLGGAAWGLQYFFRHQEPLNPSYGLFSAMVLGAIALDLVIENLAANGFPLRGLLPLSTLTTGASLALGATMGLILWTGWQRWQKGKEEFNAATVHQNLSPILLLALPVTGATVFELLMEQYFASDALMNPLGGLIMGAAIGVMLWAVYHRLSHGLSAFNQKEATGTIFAVNIAPLMLLALSAAGAIIFDALIGKPYLNGCLPAAPLGDMVSLVLGALIGASIWAVGHRVVRGAEAFNTQALFFAPPTPTTENEKVALSTAAPPIASH